MYFIGRLLVSGVLVHFYLFYFFDRNWTSLVSACCKGQHFWREMVNHKLFHWDATASSCSLVYCVRYLGVLYWCLFFKTNLEYQYWSSQNLWYWTERTDNLHNFIYQNSIYNTLTENLCSELLVLNNFGNSPFAPWLDQNEPA